jgi:hypothetical protein
MKAKTPAPSLDPLRAFDLMFPSPSWRAWRVFVQCVFGLPMTPAELQLYQAHTGRTTAPTSRVSRVALICGRRAGKTRVLAWLGAYLAAFCDYSHLLSPGETGVVMIVNPSRGQGRVCFNYLLAFLESTPAKTLITRRTQDTIELRNNVVIQIVTASYRMPRGFTCVALIGDETSFWNSDSATAANPDTEIVRAILPSLLTTGGPVLLASTPYQRSGVIFEDFDQHYAVEGDSTLVWMGDTLSMNPTVDNAIIDKLYVDDPDVAASEYGRAGHIQFRQDLQNLFDPAALAACVLPGRPLELPPQPGIQYKIFTDTASGSDESMTVSVTHKNEQGRSILDVCRERVSPFDPFEVTREFADLAKKYGCRTITGDRYSPGWVSGAFAQCGIDYQVCELTKSQLLIECLALINSRMAELPEHPRLMSQFVGLQRRVGPSGRDSVDHRPGQRDDLANAVAGGLWLATQASGLPMLPPEFRSCARVTNNMPSNGRVCYLFGGDMRPINDVLCRTCPGNAFVQQARRQHQARSGESVDLIQFYKDRVSPNDWARSRMWQKAKQDLEDELGL